MRTRFPILMALIAVLVASAAPASAATTSIDPNDAAGPLDLHVLRVDQSSNGILHVRISLYHGWNKTIVSKGGPDRWFVYFDIDSSPGWEYRGRISYSNGDLALSIKGNNSNFEPLPVKKPTAKALQFTVPGGAQMTPDGVGIATRTIYVAEDNTYFDRAPDTGFIADD
ncbi:MAG: hypothetical protein ABR600_00125 [Actinomycetota bacterium]